MLVTWFMRFFFDLLYHSFAWSYDLVAAIVSGGRWKDWVRSVVPLLENGDVLELGCGTGTLQHAFNSVGFHPVGVDESRQMLRITDKNLRKEFYPQRLMRAKAQALPLAAKTMDTIVSTFPSEYIFQSETLHACRRILRNGGKLIILLGVEVGGKGMANQLLRGIYRLTRQGLPDESVMNKVLELFHNNGFTANIQTLQFKEDRLTVLIAY